MAVARTNGRPHCTAPLFISYALDLFFLPSLGNKALYTICFSLVFHGTNYVCSVTDGDPSKLLGWYRNSLEAARLLSALYLESIRLLLACYPLYSVAIRIPSIVFGIPRILFGCYPYPFKRTLLLSVSLGVYSVAIRIPSRLLDYFRYFLVSPALLLSCYQQPIRLLSESPRILRSH